MNAKCWCQLIRYIIAVEHSISKCERGTLAKSKIQPWIYYFYSHRSLHKQRGLIAHCAPSSFASMAILIFILFGSCGRSFQLTLKKANSPRPDLLLTHFLVRWHNEKVINYIRSFTYLSCGALLNGQLRENIWKLCCAPADGDNGAAKEPCFTQEQKIRKLRQPKETRRTRINLLCLVALCSV